MKRSRILALLPCALVLALLLGACTSAAPAGEAAATAAAATAAATTAAEQAAPPSGDKPTIKLIANTWPASELNVNVAANLLKSQLGYDVEIIALDEQAQWDAIAGAVREEQVVPKPDSLPTCCLGRLRQLYDLARVAVFAELHDLDAKVH